MVLYIVGAENGCKLLVGREKSEEFEVFNCKEVGKCGINVCNYETKN